VVYSGSQDWNFQTMYTAHTQILIGKLELSEMIRFLFKFSAKQVIDEQQQQRDITQLN